MKEDKKVIVNFSNPAGKIRIKTEGKKATEKALKIMKVFDNACKEIRESERE